MSDAEIVLNNQTITSDGSFIFRAGSFSEVGLVYNIAGPVTSGSSITFSLSEVDPADENTLIGEAISSVTINEPVAQVIILNLNKSPTVKVHWALSGTSVAGVTASIFRKKFPETLNVKISDGSGAKLSSAEINNTNSLSVESRQLTMLMSQMLSELTLIRRQLESITGEKDPL
jgi:hypothetical protein